MQCASGKLYRGSELFLSYYVYSYSDPKNDQIRYVGKGNYFRAWSHLNESSNKELHALIKKRQREGFGVRPLIIQLFKENEETHAFNLEQELIAFHGRKDLGKGLLFNYTDGGEGDSGQATTTIDFRGEIYPNLSVCARVHGVDVANVSGRLGRGWSMSEALELENKEDALRPRQVVHEGVTYRSIQSFAKQFNLSADSARHFLNRGFSTQEILAGEVSVPRAGTKVRCGDTEYRSVVAFAAAVKKSVKAVHYWLETGYSPLEIKNGEITNKAALYTDWKGMAITQGEFSKICNISFGTLIKYRNNGLNNQQIFELGHRTLSQKWGGKEVHTSSGNFPTRTAFAQHLGVIKTTLSKWLDEFQLNGDECISIVELANEISAHNEKSRKACLEHASRIIRGSWEKHLVDDRIVTKEDLAKIAGVGEYPINKLLAKGLDADEIVKWGKTYLGAKNYVEPFIVRGMFFKTHSSFARYLGLNHSAQITTYRSNGHSYEDIMLIVEKANELTEKKGRSRSSALRESSRAATLRRKGKLISAKVAKYIELRKKKADPKSAAKEAGLSLSNTSRLEKTHEKMILGEEKFFRINESN